MYKLTKQDTSLFKIGAVCVYFFDNLKKNLMLHLSKIIAQLCSLEKLEQIMCGPLLFIMKYFFCLKTIKIKIKEKGNKKVIYFFFILTTKKHTIFANPITSKTHFRFFFFYSKLKCVLC